MDSSLEEVAKETESTRAFPTKSSFQEDRQTSPIQERNSAATQENNQVEVDDGKRQKMESLLERMSERCFFFLFNLTQYFLILRFVQVSQSDTPQNRI